MQTSLNRLIILNAEIRRGPGAVHFLPPEPVVTSRISRLVRRFDRAWIQAVDREDYALILTRFWHAFITIHPFEDANRRTCRAWIQEKLVPTGFMILDFSGVEGVELGYDPLGAKELLFLNFLDALEYQQ